MRKSSKRNTKRAATVLETAEIIGLSTRQVQRVMSGDRQNENVVTVFMELKERKEALIEELKTQFNPNYSSISSFTGSN